MFAGGIDCDSQGIGGAGQGVSSVTPAENEGFRARFPTIGAVTASSLPEGDLHLFLRRRRRNEGEIEPPPIGRFLAQTLELAAKLVPAHAGSLLLDDPTLARQRSPLTFVAAFGPAAARLVGHRVPCGAGIVGHVYRTGRTCVSEDASSDPRFFSEVDRFATFETRSLVATPVRLERAVCGVFELVNRRGRRGFSERDVQLVELISQYASRAILNAVDVLKQNELAKRDELTGLLATRWLEPRLEREIARARRDEDVSVLFVDVDRLKRVNDRMGHRAGSEALRRVGAAVASVVPAPCAAFRFGGDELVIVCPATDGTAAELLAAEIRDAVRRTTAGPMPHGGKLPAITVSVGVATLRTALGKKRSSAPRSARLLTAADNALYRAKEHGRDRSARATVKDDRLGRRR